MKNCMIYYFSGTGNTEYACKTLSSELAKLDWNIAMKKIESIDGDISIDYDLLCIAYPVHGFNAPTIIDEFCVNLPEGNGKKFFVVKTSGEPLKLNDASSMFFMKTLLEKDYSFIGEYHYVMPYNIIFRHSDDMVSLMIRTLREKVVDDALEIDSCQVTKPNYRLIPKITSAIVRIEHPAMKLIGKGFKIDKNKCVNCNKCMNNCPTKNITKEKDGYIFGNECLGCMRCAFNCPKNAINIGILNGWKVNGKYDFENISVSENPKIIKYCHSSYKNYFFDTQND